MSEKYFEEIRKIEIPLCLECKHFYKNEYEEFCCKAFPEGIPDKIIEGVLKCTKLAMKSMLKIS